MLFLAGSSVISSGCHQCVILELFISSWLGSVLGENELDRKHFALLYYVNKIVLLPSNIHTHTHQMVLLILKTTVHFTIIKSIDIDMQIFFQHILYDVQIKIVF